MANLTPGDLAMVRKLNGDERSRLGPGKIRFSADAMSFATGEVAEFVERLGHTGGFCWRPNAYGSGRVVELLNFDVEGGQ